MQSQLHAPTGPVHGLAGLIPILAHFLMKVFKVFSYFFSTSRVRVRVWFSLGWVYFIYLII